MMNRMTVVTLLLVAVAFVVVPPATAQLVTDWGDTPTGRDGAAIDPRMDFAHPAWGYWVKRVGLSEFPFLKIGQGARGEAMGGAFVAVGDDITAAFWNPAALAHIDGGAYTLNYTRWLANSYLVSGAMALNVGFGVIGVNVISFAAEEFEVTTPTAPWGSGTKAQVGDIAIGAQFAKRMTDKFMLGGQIRWVQEDLYLEKVSNVDYAVSSFFYTGFKSARIAMGFRNLGPDVKVTEGGFTSSMPITFSLGAAMEVYGDKGSPSYATLGYEHEMMTDYQAVNRVGVEMWLQNMLALRAGYRHGFELEDWSLGFGLKYEVVPDKPISLDVSYHNEKLGFFDAPIRVSLGGAF
ncbi:MAG: PorV/PorQ family protein [Gemmatimonadetes bacterium]|jgi:hypothetical protein|nr:PorV/PorQ family protein [Gemmatimonadota bacterium]